MPSGCILVAICLMRDVEMGTAQCEGSSSSLGNGKENKNDYQMGYKPMCFFCFFLLLFFFCESKSIFGAFRDDETVWGMIQTFPPQCLGGVSQVPTEIMLSIRFSWSSLFSF